ncbi:MAG TPA: ATP-binding protein [Thermoanaerobaculia bacterium]|jgi:signal transduction histidine kinase|nr:ATP-binding protein [Thermoanaerobaculia bacterium]
MVEHSPFSPGLRAKLALGFVGLLAILVAVGVESITLLSELGGSIDVILRENYASVIACEQMKEALERLDSGALFALAGEAQQGRDLAAEHRPRFAAALRTELHNITLPGEGPRAERLKQLYESYGPVLERVLAAETPAAERHDLYFTKLYPTFQQIKSTADEILLMNQQNMVAANNHARALAAAASRRMAVLLLAGTAFAGLCVFFLSRAILGPLEGLTRAAREIEEGNLDLTVPVASQDEIGELAGAFNSMAAGLRELRESEQAHLLHGVRTAQQAVDGLSEAVAVLSSDRKVEMANRAATELLGLRPGEAVPEPHRGWLLPLLDSVESGHFEERRTAADAEIRLPGVVDERFFRPRAAMLRDQHERPEGFVLVVDEGTGRRFAGAVHTGLLESTARDLTAALSPVRPERLAEISANLLGVSRQQESREQLHLAPVLPGDLIGAAAQQVSAVYRDKQVTLITGVDSGADRVLADRESVKVVLLSLLRNALAHTPEGGVVKMRTEHADGRVRFTISDNGGGIPAEQCDKIFEPFYQVPGTEDLGGAGLGLAIARDTVQAHGGEIHCDSEEGRGATFWFTLLLY